MKTKTRLSLLFTFITATILLAFAFVIYFSAEQSRENEFYQSLKKEAITKANLFLNAQVDAQILQDIYSSNRKILNEVEVAIYQPSFELLYHDAVDIDVVKETPKMIEEIFQKKEINFYQEEWQVVGLNYEYNGQTYIVTAAAYDLYGYNKLNNLLWTIVIALVIGLIIIFVAGRFFSKKAFQPIADMNERAKAISATHLDLRLETGNNKDELSELAQTFNEMLDRLEKSFEAQKDFVSNVAHELRTPLAAMIAELDLIGNKERPTSEYQAAIQNALSDARKLGRLSHSLLDFAKASYDPSEIAFKPLRIDEVLVDARLQITRAHPEYKINIHFESDFYENENEAQLLVNGNEYLLKVAFVNLFENACKFSDNQECKLVLSLNNNQLVLQFSNSGIEIPTESLQAIFTPFYRANQQHFQDGNGIGLPLTEKIIKLHQGEITVTSKNKQTVFAVQIPNASIFL